jgi:hypothetical protein
VNIKRANNILGAAVVLLGLLILFEVKVEQLAFWRDRMPGGGFLPTVSAIGMLLCGIGIVIENYFVLRRAKTEPNGEEAIILKTSILNRSEIISFCIIIGVAIGIFILTELVGLIIAVTAGMIAYTKLLGTETWKTSIAVGVVSGASMYFIFSIMLKIHMPSGLIGF